MYIYYIYIIVYIHIPTCHLSHGHDEKRACSGQRHIGIGSLCSLAAQNDLLGSATVQSPLKPASAKTSRTIIRLDSEPNSFDQRLPIGFQNASKTGSKRFPKSFQKRLQKGVQKGFQNWFQKGFQNWFPKLVSKRVSKSPL